MVAQYCGADTIYWRSLLSEDFVLWSINYDHDNYNHDITDCWLVPQHTNNIIVI